MVLDVFFCESHVGTQDKSHQFYQNRGAFKTLRISLGTRVNLVSKKKNLKKIYKNLICFIGFRSF
jgi:hypothetical protein